MNNSKYRTQMGIFKLVEGKNPPSHCGHILEAFLPFKNKLSSMEV